MKTHKIRVGKNLALVDRNLLAEFFGKNKNTISNWKNSKDMPVYITEEGTHYYDLFQIIEWKNKNVNERFNPNRDKSIRVEDEDEEFRLDLPDGLELSEVNLNNSQHLKILAGHPMGELIRDTLDFKIKYEKAEFELRVKKKEFLKTEELNQSISEFAALIKDSDINARAMIPIEIAEELTNTEIIKKENKIEAQKIIAKAFDEIMKEKYKIIRTQFMKHIKTKTGKITLQFLDEIKDFIQKEENQD